MKYLSMDFFVFILFGVSLASWICVFMSLVKLGKFPAVISGNPFSAQSSLCFPSRTLTDINIRFFFSFSPTVPEELFIFLFHFLCCSDLVISVV